MTGVEANLLPVNDATMTEATNASAIVQKKKKTRRQIFLAV